MSVSSPGSSLPSLVLFALRYTTGVVQCSPSLGTAQVPVSTALMIIVNGYATIFFPYQASPILAGLRIANVSFTDGTKITFVVSLISLFTILPLTYFWWRWLGVFD